MIPLSKMFVHVCRGEIMVKKDLFGLCPFVTSQKLLSGKWSIYIIYLLSEKSVRFNELLRLMPEGMTHTTLSRQLRFLEEEGLVLRKEFNQIPPKVEYSLSELGKNFQPVLDSLELWAKQYIENIKK